MATTASNCSGCGRCCCSFIFTSGLAALFLWLSFRTSQPKCSIPYFYLPALNRSSDSRSNTTIYFDLKLDNVNKDAGVDYDQLNLAVFYASNRTYSVGNSTIPGFYQGHHKKAIKKGSVQAYKFDWGAALRAVSTNNSAVFRVNMETAVRYKFMFWKTKKESLRVGADVEVNNEGTKVNRKDITLKSGAPVIGNRDLSPGRALVSVLILILLRFLEN